jgi:ubiquinone/menaquinone biosynthesis C-methylase UbiE
LADPRRSETTLSVEQARRFYDWFGAWQDRQSFYEDLALDAMVEESDFQHATSVLEFGCGTGRFAERLLSEVLSPTCRYMGVDVSTTMVNLAQQRLRRWAPRAEVRQSDGSCTFIERDFSVDRVVSTYVLDLMAPEQIHLFLKEAHRVLTADGLLCLVSLADGVGRMGTLVSWLWRKIHALSPYLVGGCRPLDLTAFITRADWHIRHARLIRSLGVTSQVIIASPEESLRA